MRRYLAALCAALMIVCLGAPGRADVFYSDVRVLLSLGRPQTVSVTPVGEFILSEAPALDLGGEALEVSAVGGHVRVRVGSQTVTAPSLTFQSVRYGGKTDVIRMRNALYGNCSYLGNMTFDVYEGAVRAINTLPTEQYLYGVAPHEMSNAFPIDALKAQAVCARGYAVSKCSQNRSRAYDILDTSQDQVYRGYAGAYARAIAAVDATRGQVLTHGGSVIEAYYSASNGGQTEKTGNVWQTDLPYYAMADDPFDILNPSSLEDVSFIPDTYTERTIRLMDPRVWLAVRRAAGEAAGRDVTLLSTLDVTPKEPRYAAPSRSYSKADVTLAVSYGEGGQEKTGQVTVTLELAQLNFGSAENTLGSLSASRRTLRLQGAQRGVYRRGDEAYTGWYLTRRRYGHGVGLSQRGAQERALAGQPYEEILAFYYVNTALVTVGTYETAPEITGNGCTVSAAGVSGIPPGVTAAELLQMLSSQGRLSVVNTRGAEAEGRIGTGYFVRVTYDDGRAFFDLPIVIYGDLTGDGGTDGEDVLALQSHQLRGAPLTGARLSAADANRDGGVDSGDLLLLIRHVNADAVL